MWLFLCIISLLLIIGGCGSKKQVVTTLPPEEVEEVGVAEEKIDPKFAADQKVVKNILAENHLGLGARPTVVLVRKEGRTLSVFRGATPIKSYPVVLGHNPRNDKLMQGDKCTPEGIYRVVTKFPHHKWSKFILLDYPNTRNWLNFAEAKRRGKIPLTAQIGGEIGIHGTEDDLKNLLGENWTEGCVALTNKHIRELYYLVEPGSLVIIKRK